MKVKCTSGGEVFKLGDTYDCFRTGIRPNHVEVLKGKYLLYGEINYTGGHIVIYGSSIYKFKILKETK